jgi:uncharacterized protein with HEPN domain
MRPDRLYLEDILGAADDIAVFLQGSDKARFTGDDKLRSAVLFKLIVIGEASGRVSAALRASHTEIPWSQIIAFRNFAVHSYFGVDWAIVWNTAVLNVPALRAQVAALLVSIPA